MTLEDFFKDCISKHSKLALAFSGGVDSAFLLYAGVKSGADITAYYVKSEFQPQFEFDDAIRLAQELNAKIKVIRLSVFSNPNVIRNDLRRCYFCKQTIFSKILEEAKADGCNIILEGTNASDDISDRPGFQALQELKVLSPLRDAGLTKNQIRKLSKEAGLFTWNKPSYACLATRIKTGNQITKIDLENIEKSEGVLFDLGFSDFRIRNINSTGLVQLTEQEKQKFIELQNIIIDRLRPYYENIELDSEARKSND